MNQFDPLASRGGAAAPATPSAPSYQQQSSDPRVNYLQQQGFSSGMIHAILQSHAHPSTTRLWILDNSAAMATRDSHRIGPQFQNIPASRWEELQECVAYQAQMAATFGHTTRFSLLNPPSSSSTQSLPQQFTVSQPSELATVKHVMMNHAPAGPTLLTEELHKLKHYITSILPHLQQTRGSVTVVLATQGTPAGHPQAFIDALKALEGLPVWIVIRLCTDEERVVDFYNALDAQVNLPYDVLDDWFGESLEVYLRNPWLCYGLPLHRFREMGMRVPVLDAIDERALSKTEIRDLVQCLFAVPSLPDPNTQWPAFLQAVDALQRPLGANIFNPVTRKPNCPWINLHDLNRIHGQAPPTVPTSGPYVPSPQAAHHSYQQPAQQQQQHGYHHAAPPPASASTYQPRPNPPSQPQQRQAPPASTTSSTTTSPPTATSSSKQQITASITAWKSSNNTNIAHLLGTIHTLFPPAMGVSPHAYFAKWKPFAEQALAEGQQNNNTAVLKRAVKKTRFFLHPDKLPQDLNDDQQLVCRQLWDAVSDAAEQLK